MSDIVVIKKMAVLKAKFIVWSEWGEEKHQRYLTGYFSAYDIICCAMVLAIPSFLSALFIHFVQSGVIA